MENPPQRPVISHSCLERVIPPHVVPRHEGHSAASGEDIARQRKRRSRRVNSTPSINKVLDNLWRRKPNECSSPGFRAIYIAVLAMPFLLQ
jgi:hypothetical protein